MELRIPCHAYCRLIVWSDRGTQGGPGLPRTVPYLTALAGTSQDIPGCPSCVGSIRSQVQDVLGYPRTSPDVPDLEAVLGPRVPGPKCPGISGDIPGCPRPGGSVRSQSPRSKMSWDIRGHPRMSQTWRQCQVPESQVQDVLGYPETSPDVIDLEAV